MREEKGEKKANEEKEDDVLFVRRNVAEVDGG